jgi:hypothetical protein
MLYISNNAKILLKNKNIVKLFTPNHNEYINKLNSLITSSINKKKYNSNFNNHILTYGPINTGKFLLSTLISYEQLQLNNINKIFITYPYLMNINNEDKKEELDLKHIQNMIHIKHIQHMTLTKLMMYYKSECVYTLFLNKHLNIVPLSYLYNNKNELSKSVIILEDTHTASHEKVKNIINTFTNIDTTLILNTNNEFQFNYFLNRTLNNLYNSNNDVYKKHIFNNNDNINKLIELSSTYDNIYNYDTTTKNNPDL